MRFIVIRESKMWRKSKIMLHGYRYRYSLNKKEDIDLKQKI